MDANKTRGLWLMPTRNRASSNVPRFLAAAAKTSMTTPGAILVDEDDYAAHNEAYDALTLPENWTVHVVKGGCCADTTEQGYRELCEGFDWVGWLADDLVPETDGWDVKVVEALTGWNIVSTNDGHDAPAKFNGATAWSGDVLRAAGYLYPPGLKHYYVDTAWEELAKLLGNWTCLMDVMVRHRHPGWTPGAFDKTTAHTQSWWAYDEKAFIDWKNNERLPTANRIGQVLVEYGVSTALPDLKGVHVMIATPSGSGRYERLFVQSLFGTIEALRQCGAVVNFIEKPYCSDITLARNAIFSTFLRSQATHLMSIDDDMGWRPQDVIKLFGYKRDFIAVAGPRKVFPPSFAVQNNSASGHAMPLRMSAEGLVEVSDVGQAFALITRECANRVAQAHPELNYAGDDGRVEHGVFIPMIVNGRYRSEDFSFCQRWRENGGKIYVDPAISLQHVGAFVWEGDWMTNLMQKLAEEKAAA